MNSNIRSGFADLTEIFLMKMDKPRKELPPVEPKRTLLDDMNPNIHSPNTQNEAKKRKLSSTQSSIDGDSGRFSGKDISEIRRENAVDDSLWNPEIYKIYCQYDDFIWSESKARKEIEQMKNFCAFQKPLHQMPSEENLKRILGFFFETIWPQGSPNMEQIQKYIEIGVHATLNHASLNIKNEKMKEITIPIQNKEPISIFTFLTKCFTTIRLVKPNGFECWYVKDFQKGPGISKWYRGYACKILSAIRIAQLNAMGVRIPRSTKISKVFPWVDFAESSLHQKTGMICDQ